MHHWVAILFCAVVLADEAPNALEQIDTALAGLDVMWVILCGVLVFFMQAGFALVEMGSIQENAKLNVGLKNLIDMCISTFIFFFLGMGIAYGKDEDAGFIGTWNESYEWWDYRENGKLSTFFFQSAFAGACATIVSGGIAGRARMIPYMIYSFTISGFVYPIVVHWVWGEGFMTSWNDDATIPLYDFAGSGVVHLVGGIMSLCGSYIIGPRINFQSLENSSKEQIMLGTFVLWFGWFGFNGGSTLGFNGQMETAVLAVVNTLLSSSMAALSTLLTVYVMEDYLSFNDSFGGLLGGLVAITANCPYVEPISAIFIGIIAGPIFYASDRLLKKYDIDDPVAAFPVHGACGIWGLLATGLFFNSDLIGSDVSRGEQFGYQLAGCAIIVGWSGFWGIVIFSILFNFFNLRHSDKTEIEGLDKKLCGPKSDSELTVNNALNLNFP